MPTLHWIGKEKVINHHLDVPYKVLDYKYTYKNTDNKQSENKIIHGDNLEALKSLLPQYEGKVDCIYIDPPYNTGNESWVYNDNVNDPKIKKWLGDVVGKEGEDLSRHDKWLCMMYPRLKLLQRLLADTGAIFISIDDNEQANLKLLCDEIFGAGNFISQLVWEKKKKGSFLSNTITNIKEYVFVYQKSNLFKGLIGEINDKVETYPCVNATNKRDFRHIPAGLVSKYKEDIVLPKGSVISSGTMNLVLHSDLIIKDNVVQKDFEIEGNWRYTQAMMIGFAQNSQLYITQDLYLRRIVEEPRHKTLKDLLLRLGENEEETYNSKIDYNNLFSSGWGSNEDADEELMNILDKQKIFTYPKPSRLIEKLLASFRKENAIILDSFAGSGTTAHAVLNLNKEDGGDRKFILIEMEDYAETITAERVRRVIDGYGDTEGTGGDFNYYTLGEPLLINNHYINEDVPLETLREYIFFTETSQVMPALSGSENDYLLGSHNLTDYYFYYKKNSLTTLDDSFLGTIKQTAESYLIYADICTLSNTELLKHGIIFKKIPRDITKI